MAKGAHRALVSSGPTTRVCH